MFGKRLKELRKERGLTQEKVAIILDCDQSMITRWEKEECQPTEGIILKTAVFFNVTADYLIGLEDESGAKLVNSNNINNSFNNFSNNGGNFTIK